MSKQPFYLECNHGQSMEQAFQSNCGKENFRFPLQTIHIPHEFPYRFARNDTGNCVMGLVNGETGVLISNQGIIRRNWGCIAGTNPFPKQMLESIERAVERTSFIEAAMEMEKNLQPSAPLQFQLMRTNKGKLEHMVGSITLDSISFSLTEQDAVVFSGSSNILEDKILKACTSELSPEEVVALVKPCFIGRGYWENDEADSEIVRVERGIEKCT